MDKRLVGLFATLGLVMVLLQAVTVALLLRGQVVLRPVVTNAAPCDDPESPCYMPFIEDQGELGVGGALPKGNDPFPTMYNSDVNTTDENGNPLPCQGQGC